ncbi:DUF4381 domain-containing protein [Flammeovirga kamogawensis]|uniref:DUF4381 domain-containing protein n=1 Tax=Flammeovirga kamogawensis TaxID=373891 RepID=A0ABX8GS38_9BACT|nr:DUF4381 domain-containing protein [Flammeovirga kamogawensis]MBB6461467.1 hypothetical protein [Flammeovirga kamogawensis]QWG06361.1 DUF4381 domain-containing protein [Flammeovirga kamogawensis]TRX68189.1 DUF4381 domain-containing protein [Flammeovirga kamogawensis]
MALQDSLQILKDSTQLANEVLDFIPPKQVDMSPSAPGWYLLGGIIILVLLIVAIRQYIHYLQNKYRRTAIHEINSVVKESASLQEQVYKINIVLKRVAITTFDRSTVAHLSGNEWINFLNDHTKQKLFKDKEADLLINGAYMKASESTNSTLSSLGQLSIKWIKNHV